MLECAGFPIICSKAACKDENGVKPDMILPACTQGKRVRRRLLVDDSSVEEMSVDDIEVEGAEEVEVDGADDVEVEGVDAVEVEGVDVMGLRRLDMKDVKVSMWVKVKYEEEVFIGRVLQKVGDEVCVRCLEKPFGVDKGMPQEMEKESAPIFYGEVYEAEVQPGMVKCGRM
ncbi:hypothetical protein BSL78_22032 [Apostichopus japonicus]|uniref:Uncharacterized protein n=1 Tax=Stichopus japonicus TaxID=307972 RepID=A0A2G8JZF5_STIJA|nr:hypothetical protein BSL78_22032 [Apostichopus japonicus]